MVIKPTSTQASTAEFEQCGHINLCSKSSLWTRLPFLLVTVISIVVWASSSARMLCPAFGPYCIAASISAAHNRSVAPPVPPPTSRPESSRQLGIGKTGDSGSGNRTLACQRAAVQASGKPGAATLQFMNAGLGTTATHGTHALYCGMGLPAVHWYLKCNLKNGQDSSHKRVLHWNKQQIRCVANKSSQKHCKVAQALQTFRELLPAVVSSGIAAISDAPYYCFLDDVLSCAPHVRFALTLRDGKIWAQRRVEVHGDGGLVCKPGTGWSGSCYDLGGCCGPAHEFVHQCWTLDRLYAEERNLSECQGSHERYVRSRVPIDQLTPMNAWSEDVDLEESFREHTRAEISR